MNQRILDLNNEAFSTEPSLRKAFFIGLRLFMRDVLAPLYQIALNYFLAFGV